MPMLNEKEKATIDALSEDELRLEAELGSASRFQREKYAYIKVRLAQLEGAKSREERQSDSPIPEALPAKPPEILQKLKWLWVHGPKNLQWVLAAALFFLGAWVVSKIQLSNDFDVEVTRVAVNAERYAISARNSGTQPAAIKYVNIFYGENVGFLEIKSGDNIIPAGQSRTLSLVLPEEYERPTLPVDFSRGGEEDMQRCGIRVSVSSGNEEEWFDFDENHCYDIEDFLTGQQSVG